MPTVTVFNYRCGFVGRANTGTKFGPKASFCSFVAASVESVVASDCFALSWNDRINDVIISQIGAIMAITIFYG